MKKYEAGFIGAGNMGGALALAAAKRVSGGRVAVSCSSAESTRAAAERLGCCAEDTAGVLAESRYVFLGVKPQMLAHVADALGADIAASDAVFVSMLAGVSLEKLAQTLGADKKVIRIMPNTACAVGQGIVLYCANANVTAQELDGFKELLSLSGTVDALEERLIDAASAISGCGPAYAYMFIEALADGGIIITNDLTTQMTCEAGKYYTLSVSASYTTVNADSPAITYQWYSQSATYVPDTISGSKYYYVGVWSTDGTHTSKVIYSSPVEVTYTSPVASPSPSPEADKSSSVGSAIIGPVIAMVLAAAAIGVGVFFLLKNVGGKSKGSEKRASQYYDDYDDAGDDGGDYDDRRGNYRK